MLLEAMACGKPVISTELGTGRSFINLHGETGLVVLPKDSDELARAINRLLEDNDLRQKFGQAGRKRVQNDSTVETMVDRIVGLYEEILDSGL